MNVGLKVLDDQIIGVCHLLTVLRLWALSIPLELIALANVRHRTERGCWCLPLGKNRMILVGSWAKSKFVALMEFLGHHCFGTLPDHSLW